MRSGDDLAYYYYYCGSLLLLIHNFQVKAHKTILSYPLFTMNSSITRSGGQLARPKRKVNNSDLGTLPSLERVLRMRMVDDLVIGAEGGVGGESFKGEDW